MSSESVALDMRTRQAFLAKTRHDLLTPVNAIIGYAEMIIEDIEFEDASEITNDLQDIISTGNRLLNLINQILDPAKIETDAALDLEAYSRNIHHQLRNPINVVIGFSEIILEKCEEAGLEEAAADARRIDDAAHRLFHLIDEIIRFSRIDPSQKQIDIKRQDRDSVRLAADVVSTLRSLEILAAKSQLITGHILIADDNKDNREILRRRLEREGHTVTVVKNGRQALETLEEKVVDLMLLDLMMPEMNGYEVLARLKINDDLRHIPVIVVSALDDINSLLRGIEAGAQDYLVKPYSPVLLRTRITALIEKKRLNDLEMDFVRNASKITDAAVAIEAGDFTPESLDGVAQRTDALGRLARVFQNMTYEVFAREERLKRQVQMLRIEIDRAEEAKQVAEIVETDYFQALQKKAKDLRSTFKSK